MQTYCLGDTTALTIPQALTDLSGTLPSNALPGGAPTGTGPVVMQVSPVLTTPNIGTPSAGTLTNCTGLPAANIVAGTMASGMTLVAPALGTPASGTLTNCTFPTLNQNTTGTSAGLTGTPAIAVGGVTCSTIAASGLCTKYNNVTTTGQGLPALVGVVTTGTHTAAITSTTLLAAPVAGGFYRISAYMKVTVATSTPVAGPITLTYKDNDGVAQSVVMMLQNAAGSVATSTGSTTTTPVMGCLEIYCGSGTAIAYAVAFSGSGTYELVLKCESF